MQSMRFPSHLLRGRYRLAGLAGLSGAALLAAALLLTRDPHPDLEKELPPGCGAIGVDFEVRCRDGMPYLMSGEVPYPTAYDSVDHPVQSLDGPWMMRLDPAEHGVESGWGRGDWADSAAIPVTVPSTCNLPSGPLRGHQGTVWFSRRFVPELDPGPGWIRLGFQGVLLRCTVWLNGFLLGAHEGGYTPFYFDVTEHMRPGRSNTLVVRADNRLTYASLPPRVRPDHNPVWGVYGGIYREVALEALPDRSLFKTVVRPYRDSTGQGFKVTALLHARRSGPACTLSLALSDPEGRSAGAAREMAIAGSGVTAHTFRFPLTAVMAWGPRAPALYNLRIRVGSPSGSETVWIRTGHRILETGAEGLRLDGRKLFLKGISKMEDDPVLGQTQSRETLARDLRLAKELGVNYLRLAHYPHHVAEVALARDMGIMVAEEIPYFHVGAGWSQWLVDFQGLDGFPFSTYGLKHLHRRDLLLHAQRSLIELIERDGNNPAVILWSLGNESYSLNDRAGRVYGWLREVARAFDPTRPTTMAEMTYYIPLLDDCRRASRNLDLASVNAYYGWYFGTASRMDSHLERFHARNPGQGILLSEFGAEAALGRKESDGIRRGDRVFFTRTYSESYQASLLEHHVRLAWDRPYVTGVSPWVFADFYCPWFPHNPVPEYNTKGILTRERVPKLGYLALQKLYRELPDYRDEQPIAGNRVK